MDYAQSRLQSRFGEFPDDLLWQKFDDASEPAAALEIAQSCGLRRWVAGITPHADGHEIEIVLRARWRDCVTEIASWMPCRWRPALMWVRELADLPALCYLARGAAPLPWMFDDPVLQVYARADSITRETMLREDFRAFMGSSSETLDQAVLQAMPGPSQISQAWLEEWRRRWPRWSDTASFENLVRLFDAAMKQPAVIGRTELLRKLRSLFRCSVLHPVLVFIYIAFAALDVERLRAGLLKHSLAHEGIISS
jgi:hypothetical protein